VRSTAAHRPDSPDITFVLWSGDLGGAQSLTAELASAMRRRGLRVSVVFVTRSEPLSQHLESLDVPFAALGLSRGRAVLRHPRKIARLVEEMGGDCALVISSGYLAAALRVGGYGGAILAVEHGTILQVEGLPFVRRLIRRLDRASGLWACDSEIAVSEFVRGVLVRRRHVEPLLCIQNGVDLERFRPASADPARARSDELVVGCAARLVPGKGVADLLRGLALGPGSERVVVQVAGEGPERPALEALAAALGLDERARFLGYVPDMPAFWRSCDVASVPTRELVESFSIAAVEAMACAIPVIATRRGALPDVVVDGVTGTLVDAGDVDGLGAAIGAYASDPALRQAHGAAARERCEELYGIERTAAAYARVCTEVHRRRARTVSAATRTHA
jgi:glycosyltransferase involved in cell wall biosynthesis